MGRPALDLIGKRFGKLVIVRRAGHRGHQLILEAKCDCGKTAFVNGSNVAKGKTKACGCLRAMKGKDNPSYRHGKTSTSEYRSFQSAKTRCTNQTVKCYPQYGGRGIKFLFDSFEQWTKELGPRPSLAHSVDRVQNDGNYEPGNVKWATPREQVLNRRKSQLARNLSTEELLAIVNARTPEYGLCGC